MISDSFLKLTVATLIGGVIYYNYSKKKVKQTEIHRSDHKRGKIPLQHKMEPPKPPMPQKLKFPLTPTDNIFKKNFLIPLK